MLEDLTPSFIESPFPDILAGNAPGKVITRDDDQRFAIIESAHPEAAIHWLAIPFEPIASIEELEAEDRDRFLNLLDYALRQVRTQADHYPDLENGFTIKFHIGSFETVPHAKLHILSSE